jgi:mycoredoxin-dependent peroxiredoxin
MMTIPTALPLQAGDVAPDFTLFSTALQPVTLSSFRGESPVLLAFFPAAFTPVCTSELCAFSEDFDGFTDAGVEVLPISCDAIPSLMEFRNKHAIRTQLLSDPRREATVAYGVLNERFYASERAYFLIDRSGVVRWSHVEADMDQYRSTEEIFAAVKNVTAV